MNTPLFFLITMTGMMMIMIMMILEQHQEVYAQTQPNSTAAATNTTTPLVNNQTQVINATNQTTTTSDREIDILWNEIIDSCLELHRLGANLVEYNCDGEFLVNDRNVDCEAYENQLLICDANTNLGMKFQSYLNTIGYSTG